MARRSRGAGRRASTARSKAASTAVRSAWGGAPPSTPLSAARSASTSTSPLRPRQHLAASRAAPGSRLGRGLLDDDGGAGAISACWPSWWRTWARWWRPWPARIAAGPVRPDRAVVPGQSHTRGRPAVPGLSPRSSHGRSPSGPMIERSWPFPASSTMSPGRAFERGGDGRATGDELQVLATPLAGDSSGRSRRGSHRSSPRGSSSVTTTSRVRSPAIRPICGRFAGVSLAGRAELRSARRSAASASIRGRPGARPGLEREVDYDAERLTHVDHSIAAGTLDRGEARADSDRVQGKHLAERDDRERCGH